MTYCCADLQSAGSQNCILPVWKIYAPTVVPSPADCKSAIQQIANLRYVTEFAARCNKEILTLKFNDFPRKGRTHYGCNCTHINGPAGASNLMQIYPLS